jgi:tetratricopeptide (TPR) repeat protein
LDDRGKIKLAFLFVVGVFISYLWLAGLVSNLAFYLSRQTADAGWRDRLITIALIFPKDYIYREAAGNSLERIKALLSDAAASGDLIGQFGGLSSRAFDGANSAVNLDPLNYRNYEARGQLAESLIPLGAVAGAGGKAASDYNQALELGPTNPALFLDLARWAGTMKENDQLQFYVDQALKVKPDYAPALLLNAQLLARTGDIDGAISLAEKAAGYNPQDGATLLEWGYLLYRNSDYAGAEPVLSRAAATAFSPSTVKYYLALCAQKLGRPADAIARLEEAVAADPGNEDARLLLVKLRAPVAPVHPIK